MVYFSKNLLYRYFDGGRSPVTWRAGYSFEYALKRLSPTMKNCLLNSIDNQYYIPSKESTIKALNNLSICNCDGSLTEEGKILAIYISPLKKQAEALNIPMVIFDQSYSTSPEIELRHILLEQSGFKDICFAEGGDIKLLISCLCFDLIQDVWRIHWRTHPSTKDYYDTFGESAVESSVRSYTYHNPIGSLTELISYENKPEYRKVLMEKMLYKLRVANRYDIENAYRTLKKWQCGMGWDETVWPWQSYIGLNLSFLVNLYEILGNEILIKIAESYFIEPLAFHKGWPDFTAINEKNELQLIEVKTSDKLYLSQIITIRNEKILQYCIVQN